MSRSFLAGPQLSSVEIPARLAMWKIQKFSVTHWSGDWGEELVKTAEHVKKATVPLGRQMGRDYPEH